jgi:hypothetical protein
MAGSRQEAPQRGFFRFLKKHEASLALFGAVLVFTTFVVKEALRDQFKDAQDALSTARSIYLVRDDLKNVQTSLLRVLVEVQIAQGMIQKNGNPYLAVVNSPHLVDDIEYNLGRWKTMLGTVQDLLDGVPHQPSLDSTVKSLTQKIADFNLKDAALARSMAGLYLGKGTPDRNQEGEINNAVAALNGAVGDIGQKIDALSKETLKAAERAEMTARKQSEVCTFVGYFTFSLGWALAFVGRLAGIRGLSDG